MPGSRNAKITSDAKHVEIGLTDKADFARMVLGAVGARDRRRALSSWSVTSSPGSATLQGSDSLMIVPEAAGATFVSVGPEPGGVPHGVIPLRGGPSAFLYAARGSAGAAPGGAPPDDRPRTRRQCQSKVLIGSASGHTSPCSRLADGRFGTAGAPTRRPPRREPRVCWLGACTSRTVPDTALVAAPGMGPAPVARFETVTSCARTLDLRTGVLAEERHPRRLPPPSRSGSHRSRAPGTAALRARR